jgi:hypothetical protein
MGRINVVVFGVEASWHGAPQKNLIRVIRAVSVESAKTVDASPLTVTSQARKVHGASSS